MKTRQEAIENQKNPVIRARLEKMTDAQYAEHQAKVQKSIDSGAVARSITGMAQGLRKK